jgi:amino acid transporter
MQPISQRDSEDENDPNLSENRDISGWAKFCNCFGLACCYSEDTYTHKPIAEVVQDDQRVCTDVPCLLALLAIFISQFVLIIYADAKGADPRLIVYGTDYQGKVCDDSNKDGHLAAWSDLLTTYKVRVCLDNCDLTETDDQIVTPYTSKKIFGSWCIPTNDWLQEQAETKYKFNSAKESMQRGIADLDTTKWLIFISTILCVILSFIYIYLISYIARIVIWLSIVLIFIGGIIAGIWFIIAGKKDIKENETKDMGKAELAFGIILFIILFIMFLILLWLKKRIELAFDMLHEASRAVKDMKTTVLFPLYYSIFVMDYFALGILLTIYLFSVQ